MPTLEFKGKSFVYAHHLFVPFRGLLRDQREVHRGLRYSREVATQSPRAV